MMSFMVHEGHISWTTTSVYCLILHQSLDIEVLVESDAAAVSL